MWYETETQEKEVANFGGFWKSTVQEEVKKPKYHFKNRLGAVYESS